MTNGDFEEQRRLRAKVVAQEAALARKRLAPLRKVESRRLVETELCEKLVCGHEFSARAGLFGGHLPKRRRCVPCLDLLEAAVDDDKPQED